ncbi:MAG: serine/threonine protein kinase [Pirellulaceae bacterium]|nr:serine/threonine protein kinase [Pirellulaceae bacterium]
MDKILGPYRLIRLLHAGNSSQIWEASEGAAGPRVAVKILKPDMRDDKAELAIFKNEFEVGLQLVHPNIIKMHKLDLEAKAPYMSMELFSQMSIKQALRQGTDSIAYMLDKIIVRATEGLSYMHSKGFVHCDVKPDNFLVSAEGDVRLIDFAISQKMKTGLAKLFSGKVKNVQGTMSYMSPEQIKGQTLDQRADVYSFGCTLFEMVSGKPPYTGSSPNELLNKHISAAIPSPQVANENVSNEFTSLLKSLLAKKPEDRLPSMWEVLKQIRVVRIFKKPPRIPTTSIFGDKGEKDKDE